MAERRDPTEAGPLTKLKGTLKQVAGSLVGNDDLAREGELEQRKADAAARARELEAEAEHAEEKARVEAELAETVITQDRLRAEDRAEAREAEVDERNAREEQQVDAHFEHRQEAL